MTMPSSGALAFSALQTEFGGSNPVSLSEYYRSGSYVPNISANTAVPTSGALAMSTFYSTMAGDVVPDAIAWADPTCTRTIGTSSTQTLTGITVAITLKINHTGDVDITFSRSVNGGARVAMADGDTFTANNNDTINWRSVNSSGAANTCYATLKNASNSDAVLDAINFVHP